MRFEVTDATTGATIDVVSMTSREVEYQSGKAKELIEGWLAGPGGYALTRFKMRSWSNGYISISEMR